VEPKWNHGTEDFDGDLGKLLSGLVRPIGLEEDGEVHTAESTEEEDGH
jgi:hypothetical protein